MGGNHVQWHANRSEMSDKLPLEADKFQETLDILLVFGLMTIQDYMGCIFLGMEAILVNFKGTEVYFPMNACTLSSFGVGILSYGYGGNNTYSIILR